MARQTKATTTKRAPTKAKTTKATKGKAVKAAATSTKKVAKKSNIPTITRPRGLTQDSFEKYMDSAVSNAEYRLAELEKMHSEGRCPHKAVQHMRSVLKEYAYMSKRFLPLTKKKRKQVDKSNNILMKKVSVSPDLSKFLKLKKGERVSRSEVNTAVTMYINIKDLKAVAPEKKKWVNRMNPGGKRCLQDEEHHNIIVPDKALSSLLNYPAYQKKVKAGKQVWRRKNKETGEYEDMVEDNDRLTYSVVQHLLAPHFPKGGKAATTGDKEDVEEDASEAEASEAEEADDDESTIDSDSE